MTEGKCMYVTHEQCENHRREQKADWQRADDMLVDEIKGMRSDFKELSGTLIKISTIQSQNDERKTKTKEFYKWLIGAGITILGILAAAGYIFG